MKPVITRRLVDTDIEAAFSYYLREAGGAVASDFVEAVDALFRHIEQYPDAGSNHYGEQLDIPELRHRLLTRFPYVVFYISQADYIDVIRVLHQQMDIPAQLQPDI
ncbi:type II toxin-antitoxin system RelE/ParE family toxin [Asticcacaulis sp. SL142]|uniref:type II toxin-antitoxin system RelE/ParE family toxin n=1 Tax=Asticcacaulis sp. SL142 TaxID=2995155 RepID=UPI00226D2EE0|nr:type II toxin-antitoxin system RelE/ParE family toxin [Asticcacaulis sp. SL142]WAC47331.1 type II toxin-antitoxin system RelE/ParE family toxin [Asticcacaulis sp. SL142]